jgi:cysteine desulfuration protein SufE
MTQDPETRHLYLLIDSDAIIVKGLAAIVMIALNNRLPEEIVKLDVIAIFERMDLLRHISPTRGNGLRSMLDRVKAIAGTYC